MRTCLAGLGLIAEQAADSKGISNKIPNKILIVCLSIYTNSLDYYL